MEFIITESTKFPKLDEYYQEFGELFNKKLGTNKIIYVINNKNPCTNF